MWTTSSNSFALSVEGDAKEKRPRLVSRILRGHFSSRFFTISLDEQTERGTTRSDRSLYYLCGLYPLLSSQYCSSVNKVEPSFKLQTKDNKAQILLFCYFVNAHKLCCFVTVYNYQECIKATDVFNHSRQRRCIYSPDTKSLAPVHTTI